MIPSGPIPSFSPGKGLQDGGALQKLALQRGAADFTAKAGGTKAAATPITHCLAHITVCATDGDSLLLPLGYPGLEVMIFNDTAHSAQIFGAANDTINSIDTAIGVAQAAGKSARYTCYAVVNGVADWGRLLSA